MVCRADTLEERFWPKVKIGEPDECWEWQACTDSYGYGVIAREDTMAKAHRLVWEFTNGLIPEDMQVLHKCDNRKCCNEKHLFLGTHLDNMRDMINKGRGGFKKGAENIRSRQYRKPNLEEMT